MARIRSVHPGLFTDEGWVSCSPLARILYIGLWTDADDQGVFEWKPLQLKMKLLPGDNSDVSAMLDELAAADLIKAFEHGGKRFGAIRNFRKFQRPKKPNTTHFLPPEFRTYVAIDAAGSEPDGDEPSPVRNPFPTEGEISPQMEDGGWRMEEEPPVVPQGDAAPVLDLVPDEPLAADPIRQAFDAWNAVATRCGLPIAEDLTDKRRRAIKARLDGVGLQRWARALSAVEASAFCLGQAKPKPGEKPFKAHIDFVCQASSFQKLIEGFYGQDAKPVTAPAAVDLESPADMWRRRVDRFLHGSGWWRDDEWGPRPGRPDCTVPAEILHEFGIGADVLPFEGRAA